MTDEFVATGIPLTDNVSDDDEFDPNAVDSDAFLDDETEEEVDEDLTEGLEDDEEEEDDEFFKDE